MSDARHRERERREQAEFGDGSAARMIAAQRVAEPCPVCKGEGHDGGSGPPSPHPPEPCGWCGGYGTDIRRRIALGAHCGVESAARAGYHLMPFTIDLDATVRPRILEWVGDHAPDFGIRGDYRDWFIRCAGYGVEVAVRASVELARYLVEVDEVCHCGSDRNGHGWGDGHTFAAMLGPEDEAIDRGIAAAQMWLETDPAERTPVVSLCYTRARQVEALGPLTCGLAVPARLAGHVGSPRSREETVRLLDLAWGTGARPSAGRDAFDQPAAIERIAGYLARWAVAPFTSPMP